MILMHKDIPVAKLTVYCNTIIDVQAVFNHELLPPGTKTKFPQLQAANLSNWNKMRAIPANRQFLETIESRLGCSVTEVLWKSMGVSLTDCYWFKNEQTQLNWGEVNLHTNRFGEDFAVTVLLEQRLPEIRFHSPDYTTDGLLAKAWMYINGVPSLVKFGELGPNAAGKNLLSANEVAASQIAASMGVNHTVYYPVRLDGTEKVACACPCFVQNDSIEFVNALQIMKDRNYDRVALYHYFRSVERESIDKMILFDHIIHNNDRHEKNFGVLRDSDNLQVIGMAPLFDSGSCFGWNNEHVCTKPFADTRIAQLDLIGQTSCDIPEPKDVKNIVKETYEIFEVPEPIYEAACRDVDGSYQILAERSRQWMLEQNEEDMEY